MGRQPRSWSRIRTMGIIGSVLMKVAYIRVVAIWLGVLAGLWWLQQAFL